jgi:hypothetical protein
MLQDLQSLNHSLQVLRIPSVVLGNQQTKRMRCVILSSVACRALRYFSTLFHKRQVPPPPQKLLNLKFMFRVYLQLLFEKFHISRKNDRDMIKKIYLGVRII